MDLNKFEFNEEVINYFHESKFIPVDFYNKSGQILIPKKNNATENEINALLKFIPQGIYFLEADAHKLKKPERKIPDGLSDTKLLTQETTSALLHDTSEIFSELRNSSLTSISAKKIKNTVTDVFQKFEKQPDAMNGLVNILELMNAGNVEYNMQMAIKRTVVAMAMKTRGLTNQNSKDRAFLQKSMNNLMVAALLCDIGCLKMSMPSENGLNSSQMQYVKNHPMVSYLMIAHEESIDPIVKRNILLHHRPAYQDSVSNNYPTRTTLYQKLLSLYQEYSKIPEKKNVANSIAITLNDIKQDVKFDEDANIIAIASEFSSLTTDVPWRKALDSVTAVKMILNNSYFSYSSRSMREFLDMVALSLCDNQMVLNEGDFVIITAESLTGNPYFEVCKIVEINRYQSRPLVERIGAVNLIIENEPKRRLTGFDKKNLVLDKRHAKYDLANDLTRRMIYVVDPKLDPELYEHLKNFA